MDRAQVKEFLEQARHHVAEGEKHILLQRELIAELEHDGHDATYARENLKHVEDLQQVHIQECDRLERMLASDGD